MTENTKSKNTNPFSKMASGAIAAVSVMLATQLDAEANEEENAKGIDNLKTASLGNQPGASSSNADNTESGANTVAGSADQEVDTLSTQAISVASTGQTALASSGTNAAAPQIESSRLPRDFVTQSPGVSDPSQQTGEIESTLAGFERGEANFSTGSSASIRGLDGEDGEDGRDGINGQDGRDGIDGQDGRDGIDGQDGRDGIDGQNGRDGIDGQDGRDGIDGQDGRDGIDGQDGRDGIDGQDGRDGIDGQDGRDGIDGQDGRDGIDGQDGRDGIDGQDGRDGIDGQDGRDGIDGINGQDGRDGVDGQDGRDGIDGQDGRDGVDGQDGRDGQTIVYFDAALFENPDFVALLPDEGFILNEGPFGTVALSLTPDQLELLNAFSANTSPDAEFENDPANPEEAFEHATPISGTQQEDFLVGGDGADILSGFGENDVLVGGAGSDTLLGGDGNDTASYETSGEAVLVNLLTNENSGGDAEGDSLHSIENLVGSNFEDVLRGDGNGNELTGGRGADVLFGDEGDDILHGGEGGDFIDGGASSRDLATYFDSDAAVSISLANDTAEGGHAEGDELDNVESLNGSVFDDFLQGDQQNNRLGGLFGEDILLGEGGDDVLIGGSSADILNGGDGIDTSDYTASQEGVEVSLATGVSRFGEAEGDTLISIENLAGSAFDDTLSGDDQANRLTGRDGDDQLFGNGGNDRLIGGLGADHLDGGEGNRDAADYSAATEAVGVDLIGGGFEGEATGDTFTDIEFIVGSDYHDNLLGNNEINRINGGEGCDVIFGRGGNDVLIGGTGNDILNGGEGNDVFLFDFADGNDVIEDFEAGVGRTDRVQLEGYQFADFNELQSLISDTDDGALLNLDQGSILFQNISADDLVEDDFIVDFFSQSENFIPSAEEFTPPGEEIIPPAEEFIPPPPDDFAFIA